MATSWRAWRNLGFPGFTLKAALHVPGMVREAGGRRQVIRPALVQIKGSSAAFLPPVSLAVLRGAREELKDFEVHHWFLAKLTSIAAKPKS